MGVGLYGCADGSCAKRGVWSVLCRPQAAFEPLSFLRFRERGDGGDDERDADQGPFFHQHVSEAFRDALSFQRRGFVAGEVGVEGGEFFGFSAGDEGGGL